MVDNPNLEAWKNGTGSLVSVQKTNARGDLSSEEIPGGRVLHISPADRRLNQEMATDEKFDFFSNGMLTPVRLIETDADFETIKSNKNLLSEDDMRTLLKTKRSFKSTIADISNVNTLRRIAEIANEEDADVSLKQLKDLEERITALVDPGVHEVDVVSPMRRT